MKHVRLGIAAVFLQVLATLSAVAAAPPADATAEHAAWGGWWLLDPEGPPPLVALMQSPPPLRPAELSALRRTLGELLFQGTVTIDYCRPRQFVGFLNGEGFEDRIEFLFTPGRITLTNETGLLRRIRMEGVLPKAPVASNTGTSVARWEGETLVVETAGLAPILRFPLPVRGAPLLGRDARVVERISLIGPDRLEIDSTLTAPDLLVGRFRIVTRYQREPPEYEALENTSCPDNDRLVDQATGATQFDLTPPPDLAPPP